MNKIADENELLLLYWNQFKQDDHKAFSRLFELSSDRLYRYGMKFANDEELVKDCIQELFIKLYNNRTILPEVKNPIFYLFGALKNLLIDAIQQKEKIIYFSPHELPFHVKFIYSADDQAEVDDDIKEKIEKVMSLLSDRQKEAIYLRFQAEMSYEEISQLLNINYQSVRNLIHRSIEKIRTEIDQKIFFALFISLVQ